MTPFFKTALSFLLLTTGIVAIAPIQTVAQGGGKSVLTIYVEGLKNQKGQLCMRLFANSQNFPGGNDAAATRECIKINEESVKYTFRNLTPGSYAVAVFHDENGDRTLNRNGAGMPLEGYGFSNNPVVRQKAPSFGQAVFLVAGPNTGIKIQMKYGTGN
jgi:uncharacterized protein (DUF2141 family)